MKIFFCINRYQNRFSIYPSINWIGSKLLQTKIITPKILQSLHEIKVFIEPFVGGGAIIIELLKQCYLNDINNVSFYCSDINKIIIEMYNQIKNNPKKIIENLIELKNKDNEEDYYRIRQEYNNGPNVP